MEHQPPSTKILPLTNLPPLPAIAMQILRLLPQQDVSTQELGKLISADPALSAELLVLANSALFGFSNRVKSIAQATTLLGIERVKSLALTVGLKVYVASSLKLPELKACWRHSLACALLADHLALLSSMEIDMAYTAGLLHDIGRLAMAAADPHRYAHFLGETDASEDVLAREREVFGVNHCEAGGMLVESWKLPEEFSAVATGHHESPADGKFDLVALIHYGCRLADTLGFAAIRVREPHPFGELLAALPERARARFPQDPTALSAEVAAKISPLE